MPTYTVTAHFTCMRCGATAADTKPAGHDVNGKLAASQTPHAPGWRDVALPTPAGPVLRGELCPACVEQLAAFILPSKEW